MSATEPVNHFIRNLIRRDVAAGKHGGQVVTRFPPEPNGYLHIGHAKSICLNFGLAQEFGGVCHLRFDDTNPVKEDLEYVHAIQQDIRWLGFEWDALRHASDYFEVFYQSALRLIEKGLAFVCDQSADEVREYRGTLTEPGRNSPWRDRSVADNLDLFQRMRAGEFDDGSRTLRAKIDMASPNINLRDPAIYRIRKIAHQNTGDAWPIYPMYDYAHCLSDAIEGITHSLCTLEFEDHRPLYDWYVDQVDLPNQPELRALITAAGLPDQVSRPEQTEFARLNLDYTVMSKRRLIELVKGGHVSGWDDPRMPTLLGLRRRGVPPSAIRTLCERVGVTKQVTVIGYEVLEGCIREDLDHTAERRMAVLDPVELVLQNLPTDFDDAIEVANHPQRPELGTRTLQFGPRLWIERSDFEEVPPKGFHRLKPDGEVRLRHIGIVRCVGIDKDADGRVLRILAELDPATRPGGPEAGRKVKGTIHWVCARHGSRAEVRLYDRLFSVANPDAGEGGYLAHLNPDSIRRCEQAWIEPAAASAEPESRVQFERTGYFAADRHDHTVDRPVFNRVVSLRDSWGKN
ncbi:MAG: glutamine--tRNA ligase/YqeY domain fusion protein [Xanthomonadales bacterium]|nr:glutamine--tRNA ligase/YqeY domain fusion protein [Xanthomonadales bacterium]